MTNELQGFERTRSLLNSDTMPEFAYRAKVYRGKRESG